MTSNPRQRIDDLTWHVAVAKAALADSRFHDSYRRIAEERLDNLVHDLEVMKQAWREGGHG